MVSRLTAAIDPVQTDSLPSKSIGWNQKIRLVASGPNGHGGRMFQHQQDVRPPSEDFSLNNGILDLERLGVIGAGKFNEQHVPKL